jgi:hypothetical protein
MVRRYVSLASVQRTIVENRPSGMDRLGEGLGSTASNLAADLRKHYRGELLPAELPDSLETYQAWHC